MMRLLILLLLLTALFASCGSSSVPAGILPGDKMGTIIWQLMQSDEYANNLLAKDSTKKSGTVRMTLYREVFDLNKTSMAEFKKSYQFYMAHPDITKNIFDSITAKAARQRTEFFKPKTDSTTGRANMQHIQMERRWADSLAKAAMKHPILPGSQKPGKSAADSILQKRKNDKTHTETLKARKHRLRLHKPAVDPAGALKKN